MSDVFRKVYKQLRPSSSELILEAKNKAEELLGIFGKELESGRDPQTGLGVTSEGIRELALAKTNLEQALMWYTKSVVIGDEAIQLLPKTDNSVS